MGGQIVRLRLGADYGIQDNIDQLFEKVDAATTVGFSRIKLKIRHGWGIDDVRTVRQIFPKQVFHVDCNGSYGLDDLDLLRALDQQSLAMIEQSFGTHYFLGHATLQSKIGTPVCLR